MNPRAVDRPPYTIVGEVPQFSRKQTAFARSAAGTSTAGGPEKERESVAAMMAEGREGYSHMDFAVQNAAWTMAATMGHLAYSWERLQGARGRAGELAELPRCEPEDDAAFTDQIKEAAQLYGADAVGVCALDRRWLYADEDLPPERRVPADVDQAVVMAVGMDRGRIMESPTPRAAAATGNGYSRMAFTAACVAELLRNLGWRALPCGNDTALSIPLAIDAGLGEMGRSGSLIHPELGPCLRLCKVLTDAPLAPDKPIEFGVREQCQKCTMCADQCEAKAISWGEMTAEPACPCNNSGVLKWPVNADLCLQFWRANGTSCADCIRACPYTPRR
ncbi:MAG: reductive dehalogenase [Armatimonadota bacterium]